MKKEWLLYGAYGYTGRLIAAEAVAQGERPVLAGRNGEALQGLAAELGLKALPLPLDDAERLRAAVAPFGAVLHAAGPYVRTAAPMRAACLATHTHYLDITGEVPVFVDSLATAASARAAGVAVISGVGFDIVPSDCLGAMVAARLPDATQLDLAIAGFDAASGGTVITALEQVEAGGLVRRNGALVAWPLGRGARQIRFGDGVARWAIPTPMGDVATAQQSTGIPNVTVYVVFPAARLLPVLAPLTRLIFWIWAAAARGAGAGGAADGRAGRDAAAIGAHALLGAGHGGGRSFCGSVAGDGGGVSVHCGGGGGGREARVGRPAGGGANPQPGVWR